MGYPRKVTVNVKLVKENGAPGNKLSFEFVMVQVMLSVVFFARYRMKTKHVFATPARRNSNSLHRFSYKVITHCDSIVSLSVPNRLIRSFSWSLPIISQPQLSDTGTRPHSKVTSKQLKSYLIHNSKHKQSFNVPRHQYKPIISQRSLNFFLM